MSTSRTLILGPEKIALKLHRMAFQVWEKNIHRKEIVMIGIADNGMVLARLLAEKLEQISPIKVKLIPLAFDKVTPLKDLPDITEDLNDKSVVVVDDVANSGKVMMYALKPILAYMPANIHMVVLVERKHKKYPISTDIVGHSLSTTLQEHIIVESDGKQLTGVYLE